MATKNKKTKAIDKDTTLSAALDWNLKLCMPFKIEIVELLIKVQIFIIPLPTIKKDLKIPLAVDTKK